jgi:hypothetical protein
MKIKFAELDKEGKPTGDIVNEWELLPSQERFFTSKKKRILFSGGVGCGKSLMLVLKAIDLCLRYPGNFVLMGRKTYVELRDSLMKEFFVTCPEYFIKNFYKAELRVEFHNGSEIIFRHLDKVAEAEIRSMNLGAAFIDQAEAVDKPVVDMLGTRLRRENIPIRQLFMSINPELTWHYAEYKQKRDPENELIEASTLENEKNLPKDYIEDLLRYPEAYKRQYVYGIWDESLLAGGLVFDPEYIDKVNKQSEPLRVKEGLQIYKEFIPGHKYQMGIDVAEGSEAETEKKDKSAVTIVDLTEYEEVAHWAGQVPPDVVAEKAAHFARMYQEPGGKGQFCVVVPEMNAIGLALVNRLREEEDIFIYRREEFDKSVGKKLKKLGWRTTRQSKRALISRFQELCRKRNPKVHTRETLAEFRSFIYNDEPRKNGAGAKTGFHDDRIMSLLIAFFEKGDLVPGSFSHNSENSGKLPVPVQPSVEVKDGKVRFRDIMPKLTVERKWTTH